MRVLLINPNPAGLMRTSPPLGLGYVGASARKAGYDVQIFDMTLGNRDYSSLNSFLNVFKPDIVGITCFSSQYPSAISVACIAKNYNKDIPVILGGIHASAYPEYILKEKAGLIDYIIKGEGEYSLPMFLQGNSLDKIPGLYYRQNGSIKGNESEFITDLDSLPSPWTVLDPYDYSTNMPAGVVSKHSTIGVVLSSRGCPYDCSFCCASVVQGRKIRLRSIRNFMDEIEYLVREKGIKEIQIVDDNFTFYKDHVLEFCMLKDIRDLKFDWTLTNGIRADRVDDLVLRSMKRAGCYYFAIGIESGSEKILGDISKNLSLNAVERTVTTADRLGFITQGFFMVGFPGETDSDRRASLNFAKSIPLDRMSSAPVMALPGSKLFEEHMGNDLTKIDLNHSCYREWAPMPGAPDYNTVMDFMRKMRLQFYLNPKRTLKHISKVRSLHQLLGFVRGFKELF